MMIISFGQYHINNYWIPYFNFNVMPNTIFIENIVSFKMISPNQEEYSILNVQ